jgi:predicted secreted protein
MEEIDIIKKEVEELKKKNVELEERLKKYTNGDNHKRYYKKNKEKVMELGANYLQKLKEENPEKLKEYRRTYYLKKKNEKVNSNKIENII